MTAVDARTAATFKAIEERLGISFEQMVAPGQTHREAHARAIAAFLVRGEGWGWADIASLLARPCMSIRWRAGRVLKENRYTADLAAIRESLPPEAAP